MHPHWEAKLLINLVLRFLLAIRFLECRCQVYLPGQFVLHLHVTLFILDGQLPGKNMVVVYVVDVEIFLTLIGENRVQLEEVLTTRRNRQPPTTPEQ